MTNLPLDDARLDALSEAIRAVTADLSLEGVLRRLAEIAAHLVNARYAALGVPDPRGGLQDFFTYGMTEQEVSNMDHLPHGSGLLGALLVEHEPIRLETMRSDSRSAGFCFNHPSMTSFLGVPVIAKGKHLGSLYLCDRLDGLPFTVSDERLISLLAGHAAIAIENARLSEQLRRLAVIEERDRIAMELHDGIIQSIYAIGLQIELTRATHGLTADVDQHLVTATHGLNQVIENLRRYIQDLKTGVNFTVSLHEQMQEIASSFESVSAARLVMDLAGSFAHLNEQRLHGLLQITRETLSNIVRHAKATEIYLELYESPTQITLNIADNGIGFDPAHTTTGNGLRNMRRRAEQIGGTLQIISEIGHGSTLTLILSV